MYVYIRATVRVSVWLLRKGGAEPLSQVYSRRRGGKALAGFRRRGGVVPEGLLPVPSSLPWGGGRGGSRTKSEETSCASVLVNLPLRVPWNFCKSLGKIKETSVAR